MKLEVFISWSSSVFLNTTVAHPYCWWKYPAPLLIHSDWNTLHIQYDRTRLDIAMRQSDFPASGAKSQSHARPSWSKAIEHLECGGCLSLDPTGARMLGMLGGVNSPGWSPPENFWRVPILKPYVLERTWQIFHIFSLCWNLANLHIPVETWNSRCFSYCGRFGSSDSCAKAIIAEGWV